MLNLDFYYFNFIIDNSELWLKIRGVLYSIRLGVGFREKQEGKGFKFRFTKT